eukprot:933296-Karenia_brevis.AAC.1
MVDHLTLGWAPACLWQDPIKWMRRDFNKVADGLADHTMDLRRTWEKRYSYGMSISQANIIVQTDGGVRENDGGAAAWIVG